MIEVERVMQGPFAENIYFLIDRENKKAIIVDPGGKGDDVDYFLEENDLTPEIIICTHGHVDHVSAMWYVKEKYNIPILMHDAERQTFGYEYDRDLKHGDIIEFAGEELVILHTPGHTFGSICILGENFMLTGDTLFAGTIGRTDLGGDPDLMMETLATKFETIGDDIIIYPGHGPWSRMGTEKKRNHFFEHAKRPKRTTDDLVREREEQLQKYMAHDPDDDDEIKTHEEI
jgi:hydroxyacylglutathione hydrolase